MTSKTPRPMGAVAWLLLLTLSLLWGGSFFFGKVALADLPPLTLVLGRVGLAALALHLVVWASGHRLPRSPATWADFFVMGLLNNVIPFSLIFWGQTQISSGLAAILNATTPLFSVGLTYWLTRDEELTRHRVAGLLLGLAGVIGMVGPAALRGLGLDLLAQLAVLIAASSYACAGLFGRRFRNLPPVETAAGQLTGSTVVLLPIALVVDRPWTLAPSTVTLAAIVGLALVSTATAYVLYFRLLAMAGPTNLLLVTMLIPVSALLLGSSILGERLAAHQVLGMAVIGLGLVTLDGRPLTRLRTWLRGASAGGW